LLMPPPFLAQQKKVSPTKAACAGRAGINAPFIEGCACRGGVGAQPNQRYKAKGWEKRAAGRFFLAVCDNGAKNGLALSSTRSKNHAWAVPCLPGSISSRRPRQIGPGCEKYRVAESPEPNGHWIFFVSLENRPIGRVGASSNRCGKFGQKKKFAHRLSANVIAAYGAGSAGLRGSKFQQSVKVR